MFSLAPEDNKDRWEKDGTKKQRMAKYQRPECYSSNDNPYPLCIGANTPQGLIENNCFNCCLYEDYEKYTTQRKEDSK